MSQSSTVAADLRPGTAEPDGVRVVENDGEVQALLDALDDADSRAILEETGEEALSAKEVSDVCDLPLSTTYRKLNQLTDANLLTERTRIRRSGKHASEYSRLVEDVVVSVDDGDGMKLLVSHRERPGRVVPLAR